MTKFLKHNKNHKVTGSFKITNIFTTKHNKKKFNTIPVTFYYCHLNKNFTYNLLMKTIKRKK